MEDSIITQQRTQQHSLLKGRRGDYTKEDDQEKEGHSLDHNDHHERRQRLLEDENCALRDKLEKALIETASLRGHVNHLQDRLRLMEDEKKARDNMVAVQENELASLRKQIRELDDRCQRAEDSEKERWVMGDKVTKRDSVHYDQ